MYRKNPEPIGIAKDHKKISLDLAFLKKKRFVYTAMRFFLFKPDTRKIFGLFGCYDPKWKITFFLASFKSKSLVGCIT